MFRDRILNVSIDRLTVIGYIKSIQDFQHTIIDDYSITEKMLPYSSLYGFNQTLQLVTGLGHISISNRENIVRYEYNPNTIAKHQLEVENKKILEQLKNISFSRLDIAIDFDFESFTDIDIRCTRKVTGGIITGITEKVETKYFGAFSSDILYRFYDKTQEQQAKGKTDVKQGWWRLEVQLNTTRIVSDFLYSEYTPFYDMVMGYDNGFDENFRTKCKNMKDFLFFKEVYLHRNYLSLLSRREKESFNRMKKEYEEIILKDYIIIGSLVQPELDTIKQQLQTLINSHNVFKIDFDKR